ncbi:MAG: amino acid ABC transporter permease [Nitrospiraceae bacterium]|nr:MAG: amino acid ABC transporter permease [Nitrospiraceae bacterium]
MDFPGSFSNIKFYLLGAYPNGPVGGLLLNIVLAILAIAFSFLVGALLGYSRLSCRKYIKVPSVLYIEIVRATPLIMLIFWFYFFLPYVLGKNISVFWSAVIALSIYAAAYEAEIFRAGILAVPRGQMEAALTSGMTRYQAMKFIVFPQALKIMVPSLVSFFVSLFKDTSVTFIIGVIELTQTGIIVSQRQPDKMYASYLCVAIGYFIVCFSMSHLARMLEKKIGVFDLESYRPDACRDEYMLMPTHRKIPDEKVPAAGCYPPGL